jgi:hypothetical protein
MGVLSKLAADCRHSGKILTHRLISGGGPQVPPFQGELRTIRGAVSRIV